jgi:hypothetical protein
LLLLLSDNPLLLRVCPSKVLPEKAPETLALPGTAVDDENARDGSFSMIPAFAAVVVGDRISGDDWRCCRRIVCFVGSSVSPFLLSFFLKKKKTSVRVA